MLNICYSFVNHKITLFIISVFRTLLYNYGSEMKFRRREKQIGVRLRADQQAALKEIAERKG